MTVRYRANGRIAEVSEAAGRVLVAARICDLVVAVTEEPPKRRKSR